MRNWLRRSWQGIAFVAALIGILVLPADVQELPDRSWVVQQFMKLDRDTLFVAYAIIATAWIIWSSIRPVVRARFPKRKLGFSVNAGDSMATRHEITGSRLCVTLSGVITNKTRRMLTNVEVRLDRISNQATSSFQQGGQSLSLAHGGAQRFDVPPGATRHLDLLRTRSRQNFADSKDRAGFEIGPFPALPVYLSHEPGVYRIDLTVMCAEETAHQESILFHITNNGSFHAGPWVEDYVPFEDPPPTQGPPHFKDQHGKLVPITK
ncbi:MAG: hypothetical protein ACTSWI_06610 [Alphaproteobacteria bacterium]